MTEAPGDHHGRGGSRSDDEIHQVAEQWAAALNRAAAHQAEGIIIEAALDACFDDRTSLLLMSEGRSDLALVVSAGSGGGDDYLVVRFDGEAWAVDSTPVDWDALEDATFAVDEPAALCLRASSTKARAAGDS
jgi:hypothetical protein